MVKFAYNAVNDKGVESYGVIKADNEGAVTDELHRRGLVPISIRRANLTDELRIKWQEEQEHRKQELQHKPAKPRRHERSRQRLVIAFKDGRRIYGSCLALNPRENGFHLECADVTGRSLEKMEHVRFSDLKAIFFVKSFDGKFDESERFQEWQPEGNELIVQFEDGEEIRGHALHQYDSEQPRFYLVPSEKNENNISILVEKSAVSNVFTPEEYAEHKKRLKQERSQKEGTPTKLTQQETMGDFYFETRNYEAALEQYKEALHENPGSHRLHKKVAASNYNIGVQFIKRRQYDRALAIMEDVLRADPANGHARKKSLQLRKIIERSKQAG